MKLPKKLYRYDVNNVLQTHEIKEKCKLEQAADPGKDHGILWRCRHSPVFENGNFYGYEKENCAILESVVRLDHAIRGLRFLLRERRKLLGLPNED